MRFDGNFFLMEGAPFPGGPKAGSLPRKAVPPGPSPRKQARNLRGPPPATRFAIMRCFYYTEVAIPAKMN